MRDSKWKGPAQEYGIVLSALQQGKQKGKHVSGADTSSEAQGVGIEANTSFVCTHSLLLALTAVTAWVAS